jgi:prepilin signal peptidase PulO-like enzyme (type II secretory pathway)
VTLCVTDAETLLLPDSLTLPLIGLGLALRMAEGAARSGAAGAMAAGLRSAGAALAAGLVLLAVRSAYWAWRRRTGLGLGDVKLYAGIAAWLGVRNAVLTLFLAVVSAAAYGVGRLLLSRRARDPALKVPLGAFLCLATLFTVFFGRAVLQWYLSLFPA